MTNEEAISVLSDIDHAWRSFSQKEYKALDMAIKALSSQNDTSIEQALLLEVIDKCLPNPCDDAISREDAIKALQKVACYSAAIRARMIGAIEDLPSVTQKSGKWLITPMSHMAYCSECDYLFKNIPASIVKQFKYCPNCGMKMESEDKK